MLIMYRNSKFKSPLLILLLIICSGCSPLILPTPYQVPVVKEAGDINVNLLTGVSAFNVQAAVMPVDKLVLTSAYSGSTKDTKDGHVFHHNTFGAGYIAKGKNAQFGFIVFYGTGKTRDNSQDRVNGAMIDKFTEVSYSDYQIQPYLNVYAKHVEFYTGLRASIIETRNFRTNEDDRLDPGSTGAIEPFIGFKFGLQNLKLDYQMGIYSHANTYVDKPGNWFKTQDATLNFHVGLSYTLNYKRSAK
jgi:hypothetical protein